MYNLVILVYILTYCTYDEAGKQVHKATRNISISYFVLIIVILRTLVVAMGTVGFGIVLSYDFTSGAITCV